MYSQRAIEARLNRRVERTRTRPWILRERRGCACDECAGNPRWEPPARWEIDAMARVWWWVRAREWLITLSPLRTLVSGEPESCELNAVVLECSAPDPGEVTDLLRRMGYRFTVESQRPFVIEIDDVIPVEVRFVDASAGAARTDLAALERLIREQWRDGFSRFVKERDVAVRPLSEAWQPDANFSKRHPYDPLPGFET